jgi:hypothetical protein
LRLCGATIAFMERINRMPLPPADDRLLTLDAAALAPIVRQVLARPAATVEIWQYTQIKLGMGMMTGGVYRFTGTARAEGGAPLPWSVVLKIISQGDGPAAALLADPHHGLYWKREALAYHSGLLDDLPGGLAAARCYAIWEQPDESCWLWLEDVPDRYGPVWPLAQFARAARVLGRFNGAYLAGRPHPSHAWLRHNGTIVMAPGALEGMVRPDVLADPANWAHPLVRAAFPATVAERLLRLWAARDTFRAAIAGLPETLGHLDAWRGNLFAPDPDRLVAIDWAGMGWAAVGTDASDLFASSLMHARAASNDPATLDAAVFDSYLAGLADAGWQGDPRRLRTAYAGYAALKYAVPLWWLSDVGDPARHARWEALSGLPMAAFVAQQALLITYLCAIAEEAL